MPPISEYRHEKNRCSVTGGYVYRGRRGSLPDGAYLFGDYCSGELFLLQGDRFTVIGEANSISSFGEDQDGELYEKDLGPKTEAEVKKITRFNPDKSWKKATPDASKK